MYLQIGYIYIHLLQLQPGLNCSSKHCLWGYLSCQACKTGVSVAQMARGPPNCRGWLAVPVNRHGELPVALDQGLTGSVGPY